MDPLSLAASIGGLVALTARTLQVTRTFTHDSRHGKEAAAELLNELVVLEFNLSRLDQLLRSPDSELKFEHTSVLVSSSFSFRDKLKVLQQKLEVASKSRLTPFKWPLTKSEHRETIDELRAYAQCVQFSLTIGGCTLLSKTSNEVVDVLRNQLEAFQLLGTLNQRTDSVQKFLVEQAQELQDHHAAEEREKILDWLSAVKHEQKHHDVRLPRVAGTGEWFLESDEFRQWRGSVKNTDNALLCQGIQGSGKSVLASLVIDHLRHHFAREEEESVALAYVYCNYREHEDQSAEKIVGSLLKQLAIGYINFPGFIAIPDPVNQLYERCSVQKRQPHREDFEQALLLTCQNYDRTFIVIDALDECDPNHKRALLQVLSQLRTTTEASVSIFTTSRSYPDHVMKHFKGATKMSVGAHPTDLEKYVLQEIGNSDNADMIEDDFRDEIVEKVSAGAQNMFLLAVLQIRAVLDGVSAGEMEEALERMPKDLDNAFEETVKRIHDQPENKKALGLNTLMWVSRANRTLHIEELRDVLAVKSSTRSLHKRDRPSVRLILEYCFGLVTIDEESAVIRLVHYSVQEYLLQHYAQIFPSAENIVAEKCLRYLLFDVCSAGSCPDKRAIKAFISDYPFYAYACRYWGYHVQSADSKLIDALTIEFLHSRPHVARSYQLSQWVLGRKEVYWQPEEGDSCTGLHLACSFGLTLIAKEILESANSDIDISTKMGTTPLIKAAAGGHGDCTRMLIIGGADTMKENWYGPALHCAAEAGKTSTIKELLSSGIDVDSKDHHGRTALHCATASGHGPAIQELLSMGANINAIGSDGYGCLRMAVLWQLPVALVQLLLDNGADTEISSEHGITVLHEASASGAEEMVSLLLKYGANVNTKHVHGCTALHWAAGRGHADVLDILINHGAEVEARTNEGATAFSFAAERGCLRSFNPLLNGGADKETKDDEGLTPLMIAIRESHKEVVAWLVIAGAHLDDKCRYSDTIGEHEDTVLSRSGKRPQHINQGLVSEGRHAARTCLACGSTLERDRPGKTKDVPWTCSKRGCAFYAFGPSVFVAKRKEQMRLEHEGDDESNASVTEPYQQQQSDQELTGKLPEVMSKDFEGLASEELDDDYMRLMGRCKKGASPPINIHHCRDCEKVFKRSCDLTKHEKTHNRSWKCSDASCKYHDYGWPTEKERDRHMNDKHSPAPSMSPPREANIAKPWGSSGPTNIEPEFSDILSARLRKMNLPVGSMTVRKVYSKCIMNYEHCIKPEFRNNGQKWAVDVGIEAEFPEAGIEEGYMTFTNEEIAQCTSKSSEAQSLALASRENEGPKIPAKEDDKNPHMASLSPPQSRSQTHSTMNVHRGSEYGEEPLPKPKPSRLFKCSFENCTSESKRERGWEEHMQKAHGWKFVRSIYKYDQEAAQPEAPTVYLCIKWDESLSYQDILGKLGFQNCSKLDYLAWKCTERLCDHILLGFLNEEEQKQLFDVEMQPIGLWREYNLSLRTTMLRSMVIEGNQGSSGVGQEQTKNLPTTKNPVPR